MTNEQAFKAMARHMLAQGKRSVVVGRDSFGVEHESCRYRGPDGLKCAVGALIPDEEYRERFEGLPARQVQDLAPSLHGLNESMISTVQRIHDRWPVSEWRKLLEEECVFYGWTVDF